MKKGIKILLFSSQLFIFWFFVQVCFFERSGFDLNLMTSFPPQSQISALKFYKWIDLFFIPGLIIVYSKLWEVESSIEPIRGCFILSIILTLLSCLANWNGLTYLIFFTACLFLGLISFKTGMSYAIGGVFVYGTFYCMPPAVIVGLSVGSLLAGFASTILRPIIIFIFRKIDGYRLEVKV